MSSLYSFSTHKGTLDGNTLMLADGYIDMNIARQLSAYIKQDNSLTRNLHVFHQTPTPYIDVRQSRTWYVDGELTEVKDWLVEECGCLAHYPYPHSNRHSNRWPENICSKKWLARGFNFLSFDDDDDFGDLHLVAPASSDSSANASNAEPVNVSLAFKKLDLNELQTQSPVTPNNLTTMASPNPRIEVFGTQPPSEKSSQVENRADLLDVTADGTIDRFVNRRVVSGDKRDTSAIFVHAGAGYHSYQNEHAHLTMCAKAASQAMQCLKAGGSATEAVAVSIKLLEDNEITNAGLGSNLTIEGLVECDATIVDHFGRSGACGAVPNIKNPILLAKLILDSSLKSMSLRRVPPNMLIGEGAKEFAVEHGMLTVSNKELVTKNAKDRYKKWLEDLRKAEARSNGIKSQRSNGQLTPPKEGSQVVPPVVVSTPQTLAHIKASRGLLRDHSSAVLTGMWNEGQPDSPSADSPSPGGLGSDPATSSKWSLVSASNNSLVRGFDSSDESTEQLSAKRRKTSEAKPVGPMDGVRDDMDNPWVWVNKDKANKWIADLEYPENDNKKIDATELTAEPAGMDPDLITDTIGVIAIDGYGNIAAGSSSGGIGMKHCGRVGPAALVGIGTAVIPRYKDDEEERVVATVTSGTGEHMATTMAAHTCAERLYHMMSRAPGGGDTQNVCSEAEVMEDFITEDFMGHPGVQNQSSARAIGVLAAKVTSAGIYMHWAHNTDSFALAHMTSYNKEPKCVMSRLVPGTKVNVGAQKIHKTHAQAKKQGGG